MKTKPTPILSALWLALAFALVPVLRAQEKPPAPPAPAATEEKAAPAPAVEQPAVAVEQKSAAPAAPAVSTAPETPATPETPAAVTAAPAEEKKADSQLRELGKDDDKPATKSGKKKAERRAHNVSIHPDGDRPPFGNHTVSAESTQNEAVSVFGSTTVDGHVTDAAVSVFGNTTINGTADDAAVSVFGTTTINGKVKGEAVAVFGDVVMGPAGEVDGEVVAVLGKIVRAPGSQIHGGTQEIGSFGPFGDVTGLRTWVTKCLLLGRPLWIGDGLGWVWVVAFGFLIFYMLLALLFPRGIEKCAEVLEQRPGGTILAALLTMLLTPILIVLLCVTVVGIFLVPFLVVGLFFGTIFGKAAVHAWLGRRITNQFGEGPMRHAAVSVFFGGLLIMLLYMVPFLGFLLWKLFAVLGLGMVVYRLALSMQREKPAKAAVAPAGGPVGGITPAAAFDSSGAAVPPVMPAEAGVAAAILPAVISASTLERAGFWRRIAATFLDFIMVAIVFGMLKGMFHWISGGGLPLWFAIYNIVMWATKSTTIGGIICGLKLVRLDDRPVDWSVAAVRGLSAFLSLAVAGLGFIWVAFDDEKQSWHDKIAGTTIVRVPKGTPLL